MGKFFHRLARDCKGAVTVFVTLLLIPAVLVSGTGVDLARLYTARSILHDANQLAANSVLASYDALLQDLYGLYGVMKDDPEFAAIPIICIMSIPIMTDISLSVAAARPESRTVRAGGLHSGLKEG